MIAPVEDCVCYESSRNVHQSMRWAPKATAAAVGTSRSLCLPVLSFLSVSCPLPESKSEILGSAAAADGGGGGKWHESIELFFFSFFFHVTKVFWCCCHCCPFIRLTRAMFYLVILPPVALLFSHESFRICAHPLIQKQRQQKLASAGAFLFTSLHFFSLVVRFRFRLLPPTSGQFHCCCCCCRCHCSVAWDVLYLLAAAAAAANDARSSCSLLLHWRSAVCLSIAAT